MVLKKDPSWLNLALSPQHFHLIICNAELSSTLSFKHSASAPCEMNKRGLR